MPILALKTLKKWKGKWKGEEEEGEKEPPPEPLVKPLAEPKYKVVLVRDKERVRLLSRIYYQHRGPSRYVSFDQYFSTSGPQCTNLFISHCLRFASLFQ